MRTGIGPAGTPAPAPKPGVYKGADMATTEHRQFRESLVEWIAQTGMQILTTDCPFEGSPCAGSWPGFAQTSEHRGLADSQAAQDIANQEFYKTLRSRFNTFLRVPDPCKPHHVGISRALPAHHREQTLTSLRLRNSAAARGQLV